MRRLIAILAGVVLAALVLAGPSLSDGPVDGEVVAEFETARGLVEGADVRVLGAPAGTVESIELSEDGTALVTLLLNDGLPAPSSDASAAIRPVDLIGDNYVAFDPGSAGGELDGMIPKERTVNAPRLDDLLRTFGESERTGLKATLVEAGIALDRRGADLNEAILAARPAIEATDSVLAELGSQNAQLGQFVEDAERVGGQAAAKDAEIRTMVSGLAATLDETQAHSASLDDTLAAAPAGLEDAREFSAGLERVTVAATPLAASLQRSAPALAEAGRRAGPFLDDLTVAAKDIRPVVRRLADVLDGGSTTFAALSSSLDRVIATAPAYDAFLEALVPAAPAISEGFFQNFPDQAEETGTQPFDPFADPRRHYWRGAALLTCQSFGQPIEPGCLDNFLSGANRKSRKSADAVGNDLGRERDKPGAGAGPVPGASLPGLPGQGAGEAATDDLLDFLYD